MPDDPTPEEKPEAKPPEPTPQPDDFDKDRALATIRKQRESEEAAIARAKVAETKLKEMEDAQLSEQERIKKEADEARQTAEKATADLRDARISMALASAASGKVKDPSIIRKLVDDASVEVGEDGQVTNAAELVDSLVKDHPYLAAETKTDDRPTDLKKVLEGGDPVIEDGKPLEGEAARELLRRDEAKFHELMDRGMIKGV